MLGPPLGRHGAALRPSSATPADRRSWRLVSQIHVAETREQAYRDVAYGLDDYFEYFRKVAALPIVPEGGPDDLADQLNSMRRRRGRHARRLHRAHRAAHRAEQRRLRHASWSRPTSGPTRRPPSESYELIAQNVLPHFQGIVAPARRVEGVGRREPPDVHGRRRRRHHERHRQARRGAGGQGHRPSTPRSSRSRRSDATPLAESVAWTGQRPGAGCQMLKGVPWSSWQAAL